MKKLVEWKQGFPEKVGLYLCKKNGCEQLLLHKLCTMNGRHRWMTVNGYDATGDIEWTGEALKPDEIPEILEGIEARMK